MISPFKLKEICEKYDLNYNKLIEKDFGILYKGEYSEITNILEFFKKDKKLDSKNIENCSNILFANDLNNIKRNMLFLKEKEVKFVNLEECLSTLAINNLKLEETYNYVIEKFGSLLLYSNLSILKVSKSRIESIENIEFNSENKVLKAEDILKASCSAYTVEKIRTKVNEYKINESKNDYLVDNSKENWFQKIFSFFRKFKKCR